MERLWSPWRMAYIDSGPDGEDGCVFCDHLAEGDDAHANILYRGKSTFVILNAFPYNSGHLMVAPLRHVADTSDLSPPEQSELMEVTCKSVEIVRAVLGAHGFNVGMNLGGVAGAGIPGHLHMHVVPRWGGDTNFMPVVGETKVLPELLDQTRGRLQPYFERLPEA
jgi:ATP adenylyltransferase